MPDKRRAAASELTMSYAMSQSVIAAVEYRMTRTETRHRRRSSPKCLRIVGDGVDRGCVAFPPASLITQSRSHKPRSKHCMPSSLRMMRSLGQV